MKNYSDYITEQKFWENYKEEYFKNYYDGNDMIDEGRIWNSIKNFFKGIFNIKNKDKDNDKRDPWSRYSDYSRNWRRSDRGNVSMELDPKKTNTQNLTADDLNKLDIKNVFRFTEFYGQTDNIKTIVNGMTHDNRGYPYFKKYYFDNNKFYKNYKNCLFMSGKFDINKDSQIPIFIAFGYFDPEETEFILEDIDFISEFDNVKEWKKIKDNGVITEAGIKIRKSIKNNHTNVKKISYELKENNPWTPDLKKYFVSAGFTYDANGNRLVVKIS